MVVGEAGPDGGDLRRGFALTQHDLGEGVAQAAMVIDLGEAEVFVREAAQVVEGGVDAQRAGRYSAEKGPELVVYGRGPRCVVDEL